MKYPRYSKKDDLRCKILEKDIPIIRKLRKNGLYLREIAEKFNVSICCIRYWLLSDDKRRELNEQIISYGHGNKPYTKRAGELRNKKYRLCPEYKDYIEQFLKYKPYSDKTDEEKEKIQARHRERYNQKSEIIKKLINSRESWIRE